MMKRSDYKQQTTKVYNAIAKDIGIGFDEYFIKCVKPEADFFLKKLPLNSKILDIGCGVGTHSLYFQQKGYEPQAIDISSEMIKICKNKGLNAMVMDLENLSIDNDSLDAIWAHTSLLHMPKDKLASILNKLIDLLRPNGRMFIALRQGKTEGYEKHHESKDSERWFAYYEKEEFDSLVPNCVKIIHCNQIFYKQRYFLNYHLHK